MNGILQPLDYLRHTTAGSLDIVRSYLVWSNRVEGIYLHKVVCVAEQFSPIPGTGNGGGEVFGAGAASIGIGALTIGLAAPTGVGEVVAAPVGGAAIIGGGYLVVKGSQLIGTACFP